MIFKLNFYLKFLFMKKYLKFNHNYYQKYKLKDKLAKVGNYVKFNYQLTRKNK